MRRTAPLPAGWKQTRRRILERDLFTCTKCGAPATDVDHRVPAADGGTDDDDNLQSLCWRCHASKTGREAQRRSPWRSARRQAEPHPGLTDGAGDPV